MNLMRCLSLWALLFLWQGCGSTPTTVATTGTVMPAWVHDPYSFCQKLKELCAVGEGKDMGEARAKASAELAQFFDSSVSATQQVSASSQEQKGADVTISAALSEKVESDIRVITEGVVLKGVTYPQSHERVESIKTNQKVYYALASLNKRLAIEEIITNIEQIDEKLTAFVQSPKRSNFRRATHLYNQRDLLARKMALLNQTAPMKKVSFEQVAALRGSGTLNKKVWLDGEGEFYPQIKAWVGTSLSQMGLKYSQNKPSPEEIEKSSLRAVVVKTSATKQFLNVEGFEQFLFSMGVAVTDLRSGDTISKIELATKQTCRTRTQCEALATDHFKRQLEEGALDELEF